MAFIDVAMPVKGKNVAAPAEYIDAGMTPRVQNVTVDRMTLRKRPGTSLLQTAVIGGTGKEVMMIAEFLRDNTYYLVRAGLDKIEQCAIATKTWTDVTGATDLTGTTDDAFSWATPLLTGQRALVFTNYVDVIRKYTGTGNTAALGGTPPKTKFMVDYGAYLVLAYINDGTTNYRCRVQWCNAGDVEDWTGGYAGALDIPDDGTDITGLSVFGKYLCVHKQSGIWLGYLVNDEDVMRFDRATTGVGAICNNTIVMLPTGEQIFLASDGLHLFSGAQAPAIDSPINDELRDSMNAAYAHKSWALLRKDLSEVWVGVAIGSQTVPETVYKFNYMTRTMYSDLRPGVCVGGVYQKTSQVTIDSQTGAINSYVGRFDDVVLGALSKTALFGDTAGNVTQDDMQTNNDNGVAVDAVWESKDFVVHGALGAPVMCRWLGVALWAKGNSAHVQYSTDQGYSWSAAQSVTLDSDFPHTTPPVVYFDVVSEMVRVRVANSTAGETWTLKKLRVEYQPREEIR